MAKSQGKLVLYEKEGNVGRITLNYPERLNSWDFPGQGGLTDQFYETLKIPEEDDEIKVVIIKAAGRSFSAGHDLTTVGFVYGYGTGQAGERRPSQRVRYKIDRKWLVGGHMSLLYFPKVTIAQVQGHCIGEGLALALCCDMAIAADDAMIGHTEQRLGFSGTGIGTIPLLMLAVGVKRGREMLLTGRQMSGKEAAAIGLVAKSVPPDKLEEEVEKAAKAVTLLPRDGLAIGKAFTELVYDSMGITHGFISGYIGHTAFTNLRWEEDEYNFFKERRDKGVKTGFHARDDRFAGLV